MTRQTEVHQLAGTGKAVADVEKAAERVIRELKALSDREETEWMQALPAIHEYKERLERSWTLLSAVLREVEARNEARYQAGVDSYCTRLAAALKAQSWEVLGDATRPVIDGLVFVTVNSTKPEIRINGRAAKDMAVGSVVTAVGETLSRIKARRMPPEAFLALLEQVYDEVTRAAGAQSGSQAHISAIHQRVLLARQSKAFLRDPCSEAFKEYPVESFRADLYGALTLDAATDAGRRLRVTSGSDSQDAVFMVVPALGRPGYVGRLWFEG